MERRFTRLRRGPVAPDSGAAEVPSDGMCLSVFLVLEHPARSGAVLLGKLNPAAPWWEIGAVDPKRFDRIADRWMLPSRQLMFFESPEETANQIFKEQLETDPIALTGPRVFSDPTYRQGPDADPHWDIHLVYRGTWATPTPPRAKAWTSLEFVDVAKLPRADIARGQGDVLELVGLRPGD